MIVIINKVLPFGRHFLAINLLGVVFSKRRLTPYERNHEYIHTLQQRELFFIGFYLWYLMEYVIGLFRYRNHMKAYHQIRFEKEAYRFQNDLRYAEKRKYYTWFTIA